MAAEGEGEGDGGVYVATGDIRGDVHGNKQCKALSDGGGDKRRRLRRDVRSEHP